MANKTCKLFPLLITLNFFNIFPVSGKNQTQIGHISLNLNSISSHLLFFPLEEAKQAFKKENLPYRYVKKFL